MGLYAYTMLYVCTTTYEFKGLRDLFDLYGTIPYLNLPRMKRRFNNGLFTILLRWKSGPT